MELKLRDAFSPVNTFRNCVFSNAAVIQYAPYQTLFDSCSFNAFNVTRMRANLVLNSTSINQDLGGRAATVLFRGCRFERSTFKECYFDGVAFEDCTFVDSEALDCDFAGAAGSHPWEGMSGDPIHVLFERVMHLIHERIGPDSSSAREMQKYIGEYRSGSTRDLDFAGRLRSVGKASGEWERIADQVLELLDEYF
jgi:hypothetical protein